MSVKGSQAQRARQQRIRDSRQAARIARENPVYFHEQLALILDSVTRIELALKHTDSKAQTAILRIANLQSRIDQLKDEHRTLLTKLKDLVYDPEARRFDETERVAHAISNAKPGATS